MWLAKTQHAKHANLVSHSVGPRSGQRRKVVDVKHSIFTGAERLTYTRGRSAPVFYVSRAHSQMC